MAQKQCIAILSILFLSLGIEQMFLNTHFVNVLLYFCFLTSDVPDRDPEQVITEDAG